MECKESGLTPVLSRKPSRNLFKATLLLRGEAEVHQETSMDWSTCFGHKRPSCNHGHCRSLTSSTAGVALITTKSSTKTETKSNKKEVRLRFVTCFPHLYPSLYSAGSVYNANQLSKKSLSVFQPFVRG